MTEIANHLWEQWISGNPTPSYSDGEGLYVFVEEYHREFQRVIHAGHASWINVGELVVRGTIETPNFRAGHHHLTPRYWNEVTFKNSVYEVVLTLRNKQSEWLLERLAQ